MKTANDSVADRNILEAERSSDMEQQPNSRWTEYIATGTRIVWPLIVEAVDKSHPKYSGLARLGLRVLNEHMDKKGSEETSIESLQQQTLEDQRLEDRRRYQQFIDDTDYFNRQRMLNELSEGQEMGNPSPPYQGRTD